MEKRSEVGPLDIGKKDVVQILCRMLGEVKDSVGRDVNGAELLCSLLNTPWLQSLLKLYECLQQFLRSPATPYLCYASGLSLEILSDLRSLPYPSHEARGLSSLLTSPHIQALLSAHDVVGLKDYEPVLPPLPDDLPDDEEAMRIICLVKNNQPLESDFGRGNGIPWESLLTKTGEELPRLKTLQDFVGTSPEKSVSPKTIPPSPQSFTRHNGYHHNSACWDRNLSCSAPCVCNSVILGMDAEGSPIDSFLPHYAIAPWSHMTQSYLHTSAPPLPPKLLRYARTAPPSPMLHHHAVQASRNLNLTKQESLDVQLLDQAMESMQQNAMAVVMLAQALEKLSSVALTTQARANNGEDNGRNRNTTTTRSGNSGSLIKATAHCYHHLSYSSSLFNSTSVSPDQPVASLSQPSFRTGSPKGGVRAKVSLASPTRRDDKQFRMPNGLVSSHNQEDSRSRIGCLFKHKKKKTQGGATIRRDEMTGEIYIARVIHGGLAERSGLLHAGDRLVEVNGYPVFGLEPEQIIQILIHCHGTVMFKVVPITDRPVNNKTMLFVRAMADYNPQQDPIIPCVDAGMAFRKGDLLEIVDQTDPYWWQAKKLACSSACAGLVPSACLLKRKEGEFCSSPNDQHSTCIKTLRPVEEEQDILAIEVALADTDEEAFESEEIGDDESEFSTSINGIYLAGFRRSLRMCRRRRTQGGGSGLIFLNSSSPYEEVVRYQHHYGDTHRLIVLLGPSGVGVNELRRKLLEINPKTFQGATPHTTRPRRVHEERGREYHFISRDWFENMVCNHRFVEYGEYRGHLYGTSKEAIRDVLAAGKICIIDIEPCSIESVRTHELKAYIIYIKPPDLEQMRQSRIKAQLLTGSCSSRPFRDEDFIEIEEAGRRMEQQYSQYFDYVIVNDGLQASCVQLLTAVRRAQEEPQWVPASWIRPTDQL